MGAIKYLVICLVLLTGIAQAQLSTSGGGGGTSDSIGVDTDGDGTVDGYIYPSFLKKGANITFTLDNDTLIIAGAAGTGTADSMGVDTNGDGTVDGYMYSTAAGAAHFKKGRGVLLTLDTDTVDVALDSLAEGLFPIVRVENGTTGQGQIYFYEDEDFGSNYVVMSVHPNGIASSLSWIFPIDDGDADDVLHTEGSGALSWSPAVDVTANYLWTGTHDFAKETTMDSLTVTGRLVADSVRTIGIITAGGTLTANSVLAANNGITVNNGSATAGFVQLAEDTDDGANAITLIAPNVTTSYFFMFPVDDGNNLEVLQTDGSGITSWVAQTGGGSSLWDTLGSRDVAYLLGSADTTLRLDRDAANDTTTMSVPVGVLKIAGGTGTPVINFNLATNLDSIRFDSILADIRVGNWNWADSSGEPPFWVDSAKLASVADTIGERGNALLFHGGYSRHNFDISINVSGGAAYYVIDDHDTPGDSNDIWLSNDGDGGGVVMYTVELPDSVLLTNGTATTNQENFICYTYNSGSPALIRKASNPEHDTDGAVNDSVLYIGEVGLGAVAGGTAVIRKNNLRKSYLHKFVQRVTHANGEVHWHEDVTPSFTTPARNISTTRGFVHKLEEIVIPASGTSLGHANTKKLIIPVYPDSAFAVWDSLAGFLEYGDGGTISSTGAGHFVNLVLWGSASDADTSDFQYYLNIQNTASYNTVQKAEDDVDGVTVFTIPEDFNEVGFLICRMVYGKANDSIMDLTDGSKFKDLRNPQGGGGGAGSGVVTDSATIAGWNYRAMTASVHLSTALDDETGTGVSVFNIDPNFTGKITADSLTANGVVRAESLYVAGITTLTGTTIAGGIQLSTDSLSDVEVIVSDTVRTTILSINGKNETGNKHIKFNLADPSSLQSADGEWCLIKVTEADLTITRIDVTLDADPTTEAAFSIKFADAFIGLANTVVIDDTATVAGVTTVTGGFGDATVPAGKCIFFTFDAAPDVATTQMFVDITYDFD